MIIEANPADELTPLPDRNYWIRATLAAGCSPSISYPVDTVGVIRYEKGSTRTPTTPPYSFNTTCKDEPYASLVPIVSKTVGKAVNDCE